MQFYDEVIICIIFIAHSLITLERLFAADRAQLRVRIALRVFEIKWEKNLFCNCDKLRIVNVQHENLCLDARRRNVARSKRRQTTALSALKHQQTITTFARIEISNFPQSLRNLKFIYKSLPHSVCEFLFRKIFSFTFRFYFYIRIRNAHNLMRLRKNFLRREIVKFSLRRSRLKLAIKFPSESQAIENV